MKTRTQVYEEWIKSASDRGVLADWLSMQQEAHKVMRSDSSPVVADPELIKSRIYESFKLGTLAGLLAAAAGAGLGATVGVPDIGAALGGYLGLLGGTIKGQANANKSYLAERGIDASNINWLRFLTPNQGGSLVATSILPESGFLTLKRSQI